MASILCHLGDPRKAKPATTQEYGKLRDQIIQKPWSCLSERDFIHRVTRLGCPFYSALMNGRDLMEKQSEKLCWRLQTLVALDFDACPVSVNQMIGFFRENCLAPWASYYTFSNKSRKGGESYRLLWRVENDLNLSYEECSSALRTLRLMTGGLADARANNPTRMWQGCNSGVFHYDHLSRPLVLRSLL